MNNRKKLLISIISLALFFLLRHFLFYNRGFSLYEEGYYFYIFDLLAKGKILYKEVFTFTAPIADYFFALVIKIFGSELLIVRAASIVLTTLGLITIFFILKEFLSFFWSWIGAVVSYSLYYLWWYSYGYEFGSLFCYLSILSMYVFIKKNKRIYFILPILFTVGSLGYTIFPQGIPLFLSILITLSLFYKKVNYKYISIYLGSVILINLLIYAVFMSKSSFSQVFNSIFMFIGGVASQKTIAFEHKFPFLNLFEYYNAHFPKNFDFSSMYLSLKAYLYIFIYYMPLLNLILFKVNYSRIVKSFSLPLKCLYINLFIYSLFILIRPYLMGPQGHSDAFLFSPSLLFFYLNLYYVLKNICKDIFVKYKIRLIKYGIVLLIAFFYIIIQIPNLNPELNQKEFNFKHIRGVKSTNNEVNFVSNIIKSIEKHSKKGDYVYSRGQYLLSIVTERPDPFVNYLFLYYPMSAPYNDENLRKKHLKKMEEEFINLLAENDVKVVCLDNDMLDRFEKYNLIKLQNFLHTNYEIKDYFNFDTSQQKYKIGGIEDYHIFVLKE